MASKTGRKIVASACVSAEMLERLDRRAHSVNMTRSAYLAGLIVEHIDADLLKAEAAIRNAMSQRGQCTVRELKQTTHSRKISVLDWDKALATLCKSGEMRVEVSPQGKKIVILLKRKD